MYAKNRCTEYQTLYVGHCTVKLALKNYNKPILALIFANLRIMKKKNDRYISPMCVILQKVDSDFMTIGDDL